MDFKKYVRSAAGYKKTPPAEKNEVVQGLARPGHVLSITGGPKSHKSFALLDLALQCASFDHGRWMGLPTKRAKVLYCNMEIEEFDMAKRISHVGEFRKCPDISDDDLRILHFRNENFNPKEFVQGIKDAAIHFGSKLIIIDPLYTLYDARTNENDAGSMLGILRSIGNMAKECDALTAFVHHFSKGDQSQKAAQDRGSGSGTLRRFPDALISITELESKSLFRQFKVEFEVRSFAPIAAVGISWDYPCFSLCKEANLNRIKKPVTKAACTDSEYLSTIKPEGSIFSEWMDACISKFQISESTFLRASRKLSSLGRVLKVENLYFNASNLPSPCTPIPTRKLPPPSP